MPRNNFPHRKIHTELASPLLCKICQHCGSHSSIICLHHDHLANYARDRLKTELNLLGAARFFPFIWNDRPFIETVLGFRRFDPISVCPTCNVGDGWGKTLGWCGLLSPIYPPSFSMTVSELLQVRMAKKDGNLEEKIRHIWNDLADDHFGRRCSIDKAINDRISAMQLFGPVTS